MEHFSNKKQATAFVLCNYLGFLGAHRFYTGKYPSAILMTFTLGGMLMWQLIDLFMIIFGIFTDSYDRPLAVSARRQKGQYRQITVFILCLLLGFAGGHRFYVGKNCSALFLLIFFLICSAVFLLYVVFPDYVKVSYDYPYQETLMILFGSVGLFVVYDLTHIGCGSFTDGDRLHLTPDVITDSPKLMSIAYMCCLALGFFGVHRLYVKKYFTGLIMLITQTATLFHEFVYDYVVFFKLNIKMMDPKLNSALMLLLILWAACDFIRIGCLKFKDNNGMLLRA